MINVQDIRDWMIKLKWTSEELLARYGDGVKQQPNGGQEVVIETFGRPSMRWVDDIDKITDERD